MGASSKTFPWVFKAFWPRFPLQVSPQTSTQEEARLTAYSPGIKRRRAIHVATAITTQTSANSSNGRLATLERYIHRRCSVSQPLGGGKHGIRIWDAPHSTTQNAPQGISISQENKKHLYTPTPCFLKKNFFLHILYYNFKIKILFGIFLVSVSIYYHHTIPRLHLPHTYQEKPLHI